MSELVRVIRCRGIGENPVGGMCEQVTRRLSRRFESRECGWGAEYGPVPHVGGVSYEKSLADGRPILLRMIDEAPGCVVLVGFSGGADLVSMVADEIGAGLHPRLSLSGVALIADPSNPQEHSGSTQWGVAGSRHIRRSTDNYFPVWRANDPNDPIPLCDADSPLRWLADSTAGLTLRGGWTRSTYTRLAAKQMQQVVVNWNDVRGVGAQFARARFQLDGYLRRGDHVSYARRVEPGTGGTWTDNLAAKIEAGVR